MKKFFLTSFIAALLVLIQTKTAFAGSVTIHNDISNNSDGSSNSINENINNQVNTDGSNTTSSNHTHIETTVNGKTQVYDSDKGGNVSVHTTNGETHISVNGEDVTPGSQHTHSNVTPTITQHPTPTPHSTQSASLHMKKSLQKTGFWSFITNFFAKLFHSKP